MLEAVIAVTSHPTAGEVFARLERRRPKISRATVFRNLEGLVQMGVITKTCHPGRGVRYDGVVDRHHHLVCMRCNTVIDVADPKLDAITVPDVSAVGFEITDLRVQMRGLCQKCRKEKKS